MIEYKKLSKKAQITRRTKNKKTYDRKAIKNYDY